MMSHVNAALRRFVDRAHALRMLRRAVLFWAAVRGSLLFLSAAGAAVGSSPVGVLLVMGIVAFMCHVDARFMREPVFYANLGTPAWAAAAFGAAWSAAAEAVIIAASAFAGGPG